MNLDLNNDVVEEYQQPKHELLKGKCLIQPYIHAYELVYK